MEREVHVCRCRECRSSRDSLMAKVHAALNLVLAHTDEKSRRLIAGLEAMKLGRGGVEKVAEITGLDPKTIARGVEELETQSVVEGRVRQEGGGRPPVEKKRPADSGGSGAGDEG